MNINDDTMCQIDSNKTIIQRSFESYNNRNEAVFEEILFPGYINHGQSACMGGTLLGEEMLEPRMTSNIL